MDLVAVASSAAIPTRIRHDGFVWSQFDTLVVGDEDSAQRHELVLADCTECYPVRRNNAYPGGARVWDAGRVRVGGEARFVIGDAHPGRAVLVVQRVDQVFGAHQLGLVVNGHRLGAISGSGEDRVYRWRNTWFEIPGELVTAPRIAVTQRALVPDQHVSMYRAWCFQRGERPEPPAP